VLGFLDARHFLGGRSTLDRSAAEAALDRLARSLGVSRITAAEGVHRVVNTNMAEGIRVVSVRRGVDPRRFALLSFGGAAGLHVTDVARQLDLTRVIVPRVAAVLSAWGMLATDLRFELARTHIGDAGGLDGAQVKRLFSEMAEEASGRLRQSYNGPMRLLRSVDMRYGEQIFEINVALDDIDWSVADPLPQIVERFHGRHEELYTYAMRDQEAVLVNARVAAVGVLPDLPQEPRLSPAPPSAPEGKRRVYLGQWIEVPRLAFEGLAPGQTISGPAIVESAMTTVLLRPGDRAEVTPHGWLDVAVPLRSTG
jgi:N-methylhydantoinase A